MFLSWILNLIGGAVSLVFQAIGSLPFVSPTVTETAVKFVGWGCYIVGSSTMSMIFISLTAWASVFTVLGVLKFIKTYIPIS